MSEYKSIVLEIQNYVEPTDKYVPLTGVHSVDDEIAGWQWDRRRMPTQQIGNTRYLTYVGGHEVGLLDGTQLLHWQSGVLDGIDFYDITHRRVGDDLSWTPRYRTGAFSVYWDDRALYSDHSFSTIASYTEGDQRTVLQLRDDAVYDSISANLFKRTGTYEIMAAMKYQLVETFTGVLDGVSRVDPGVLPDTNWNQVESRKNEMVIYDGALYFNQLAVLPRGVDTDDEGVIKNSWENKGAGLQEGRPLFLDYFPVRPGSLRLVSVDATGVVTEWSEKTTLNFSTENDLHFSVNYDLGVITTGGYRAPDLVLDKSLSLFDTEIEVIVSSDINSYPEQGLITIGNEQIYYLGKSSTAFTDCIRGYGDTEVVEHSRGAIVQDVQHGKGTSDTWYVMYEAVPRVDYEVTDYALRTANYSTWLDVRALVNVKSNNIVQIVSQDTNLAEIVLTTDDPVIGGNLFGPVYYGTDTSKLTATAYDSAGNPVEDIELTTYIKSGPGYLNGTLRKCSSDSNSLGQTNCFFSAPFDQDSVDMEVTKVEHVGADTHMTVNFNTTVTPQDVWVFQILKHDPTLGTVGDRASAFNSGIASDPYGLGYIDVWTRRVENYDGGILRLQDTSSVIRNYQITNSFRLVDGNDEPYTRFYTKEAVGAGLVGSDSPVWLFQPGAVEWNESKVRGARVILYEWNAETQHPVTGGAGAYAPVRPDEVQGNTLIFKDRNLPIPSASDTSNNLGAYIVIAPSETRFAAYGRDPFTGNLITSNDVRLRLRLPNTLSGVDESGALPIPYGWTLITEEFNIGAGIGGANFITINPAATGINQFSLTGVI